MKIERISQGLQVADIYWKIQQNPQLWDEHKTRTEDSISPHNNLSDIWARFGEAERAVDGKPHDSKWYPAADVLGVKPLCFDLMRYVHGVELGGVLITRIPPGATCKPHKDTGWHALRYEKFAVQITSAPGQLFQFEGESLETKPGDVFTFNNQNLHWVTNDTKYERITMIACIRKEK